VPHGSALAEGRSRAAGAPRIDQRFSVNKEDIAPFIVREKLNHYMENLYFIFIKYNRISLAWWKNTKQKVLIVKLRSIFSLKFTGIVSKKKKKKRLCSSLIRDNTL
jgi:hypothetical protein